MRANDASASRVLVFRTGHLGDTVCAIPAFRLIRQNFPQAELTLLCDRPADGKVATADVIGRLGLFDRIVTYESGKGVRTALELRRCVQEARPDLVALLPGVRETSEGVRQKKAFLRLCGVRNVWARRFPETRAGWQPNEPRRLIEMLHGFGMSGEKPPYGIPIDEQARAAVERRLATVGVDVRRPFLIFCGGGKAATQCWPLERYAGVLRPVSETLAWPVVGLGGPRELFAYRALVLPKVPRLHLLPEAFSLAEVFEILRMAAAYLGNDTGPMHAAASVECPVAVVMSARNAPGTWDPDVEPRLIVRHRTDCEDCFLQECTEQQHRCMMDISVERVIAELMPFLHSLKNRGNI